MDGLEEGRIIHTQEVTGSSPVAPTIYPRFKTFQPTCALGQFPNLASVSISVMGGG